MPYERESLAKQLRAFHADKLRSVSICWDRRSVSKRLPRQAVNNDVPIKSDYQRCFLQFKERQRPEELGMHICTSGVP